VELTPIDTGHGKPAIVKLYVNGRQTGEGRVDKTVPFRYSVEPFDVGIDNVSAVSEEYKPSFAFKGRIEQVKPELK
jgi:arylsulfatase